MTSKRLLSVLLALVLCLSLSAVSVFATELGEETAISAYADIQPVAAHDPVAGSVTLTWPAVPGAVKYHVYAILDINGSCYEYDVDTVADTRYVFEAAGLGLKQTHTLFVTAIDLYGAEIATGFVDLYVGLNAPFVEYYNNTNGEVVLNWNPDEDVASYDVYRAPAGTADWAWLTNTTALGYTDSDAAVGVNYDYMVKAIGHTPDTTDPFSATITACRKLPCVDGIKGSNVASTGKIQLSWDPVEGAVSYKVYRATKEDGSYSLMKTVTDGTTYVNASAKAGKTYFYKIVAVAANTKANSEYSYAFEYTCDCAQPVITMGNDAATGKITIKWAKVEGAVKYQVYRADTKNGTYKLMKTVDTTTYTNSNAKAGKTYYYKVRAVAENADARSAFSAIKSRLCDCAQPVIKVAASTTSSIKLSWAKVEGATKYQIQRATALNGTYKTVKTTTSLSWNNTGLTAGKTYYYRVKAIASNTNANSVYSAKLKAKATIMAPALSKSATVTSTSIKITWEKVTGANGYYVYRRPSSSNTWTKVKTITSGSTVTFTNKDIKSGNYYYCVEAYKTVNGKKQVSLKSDPIRVRTLAKPTLTVDGDTDGFYNCLSWNKRTGATGYQVWYKKGENGTWKRAATVDKNTTSYTHDVTHGYYYYYKVRAIYKYDGVTSFGSYSNVPDGWIHYYYPNVVTVMSDSTDSSTTAAVILIKNNGVGKIRFYAKNGKWLDADYYNYDRDIVLFDYDTFESQDRLVKVNYVDVAAGETTYILVGVDGSATWYDENTSIYLRALYDGIYYDTYTSSAGGFRYYVSN